MPFKLHPSVWISPFNFRSGFELEKCITLLKGKNEPTRLIAFKSPLKVEVEALNVDAFQFRMRKDVGRNLVVEAVGILERKLDGTQISGEVRFSRQTIFILFLILAIQAPIFIPMFGPGIIALDLLMVSIFTVVMISGCNGLTYQLNTLLEAIPESDQQSLIVDFPKHYSYRQSTKNLLLEIAGLLFVALFFLGIGGTLIGMWNGNGFYCSTVKATPRTIISSTVKLTPVWSTNIAIGEGGYDKPAIVLAGDKLYAQDCKEVTAFDLQTGTVSWISEHTSDFGDGISGQMTVDAAHNKIYGRKDIWGIRAISMVNGKILWTSGETLFERALPYLELLADGQLLAENDKGAWYVNPDNGHLQPTTVVTPYGNLPQIAEGVELSLSACESCLQASDLATGNLLWQIGSRNSPALVSNAVVNNHTVYIMEQHAQLLLLDLHTGQKVGAIQFELPKNQDSVHNGPGQISGSYLSIQHNILAISFHDTNVLSVYSISG